MLYYCKQGYDYQAKNRLQKAAQEAFSDLDGLVLEKPDAMTIHMAKLVDKLNRDFPRCSPLSLGTSNEVNRNFYIKDSNINSSHLISFTLYPVKGEFTALPNDGARIQIWHVAEKEVSGD